MASRSRSTATRREWTYRPRWPGWHATSDAGSSWTRTLTRRGVRLRPDGDVDGPPGGYSGGSDPQLPAPGFLDDDCKMMSNCGGAQGHDRPLHGRDLRPARPGFGADRHAGQLNRGGRVPRM